jgi:hypothetical protein
MNKSFRDRLKEIDNPPFVKVPLREVIISEEDFLKKLKKGAYKHLFNGGEICTNVSIPKLITEKKSIVEIDFLKEKEMLIKSRPKKSALENGLDLLEVKEKIGHGGFLKWINECFPWSRETARRMMKLAEKHKKEI